MQQQMYYPPQDMPQQGNGMKWALGLGVVLVIAYIYMSSKNSAVAAVPPGQPGPQGLPQPAPRPVVVSPPAQKWMFYQGLDSGGNDIGNFPGDLATMKAKCLSMPDCKGYNDNGLMKNVLLPKASWSRWTDDANKGFRVPSDRVTDLPSGGVPEN